jgi:hypothetical protein
MTKKYTTFLKALVLTLPFIFTYSYANAKNDHTKALPTCDNSSVVSKVVKRQVWADTRTWKTDDRIAEVYNIRENRSEYALRKGVVSRRYCAAQARMHSGKNLSLHYLIEEDQGFASIGWGIEYCLSSRDFWYVHGGFCRSLARY